MNATSIRARVIAGSAGAALLAGLAFAATAGADPEPRPAPKPAGGAEAVVPAPALSVDAATEAARASLDAAEKGKQRVTVAVVDRAGNTRVLLKGDGAGPQSAESAERKAYTAVAWNAKTSDLSKRVSDTNRLNDIPGTLFLGGGVPVASDQSPIAGIGVAGAPSGDLDKEFAQAGLDAIGDELR